MASTASCSISRPSNRPRSAREEAGRCATTVPIPGCTSRSPSAINWVTTLCAVFGLILSALLSARTDGNVSPGRSCPDIMAFFAAKPTCSCIGTPG